MFVSAILLSLAVTPSYFSLVHSAGSDWFQSSVSPHLWSFAVDCVDTGKPGTSNNPSYDGHKLFRSNQAWAQTAVTSLRSWGFNSLGGWCDTDLLSKAHPRLPYIEVLHLGAYDKAPWNDMYAPDAAKLMGAAAHKLIPPLKSDPYLIGYCTDNELGWWDDTLFLAYFKFPPSAPGKQALIASLRNYYQKDFEKLKRDWIINAEGFDDLAQQTSITLRPGTTGIRAVHAFNHDLAVHYYKLAHDLVRREDPNHLVLGDRYCQYYNLETAEAAPAYVDVISTNDGADWLDGSYTHFMLDTLHRLTQKPVLITEFYFAARENRSGSRNSGEGFPTVQTQAERAIGFGNCVRNLAKLPYVVGAHWFQFYDEPKLGRGDGEDFNMGMVDVYGKPYEQMVAAAQAAKPETVHARPLPKVAPCIPKAPAHPMADRLLTWDRERGYIPSPSREQWADLYACHDADNLYVGLVAMEYMDEALWPGGKMASEDRPTLQLQLGSWHATIRFNGKGPATCTDPRVQIAEHPGLKHTLSIRIPKAELSRLGRRLIVKASLFSHGHGYRMDWNQTLPLR